MEHLDVERLALLLDRLAERLVEVEKLEEEAWRSVFDLIDGIDALHRLALHRLAAGLHPEDLERVKSSDAAVEWLLWAYGVGVDERSAAEKALEVVRPYIRSHGGTVELREVENGVVRLGLDGACSGCTASSVTLQEGIEKALREHLPGFVSVELEDDDRGAEPHPPPVETFIELGRRPA